MTTDVMGNEIRLGDLIVVKIRHTYSSDLGVARVVSMPRKRKTIGLASCGYRDRLHVSTSGTRTDFCVVLERAQPEIAARLEEWNDKPLNDKPNLAEWLGRSEEDVLYWTENRVNSGLD